jgi:hypothetical protein
MPPLPFFERGLKMAKLANKPEEKEKTEEVVQKENESVSAWRRRKYEAGLKK